MDKNLELQQLNSIMRAQAKLIMEYVEYSLAEAKGRHSNTVNADSRVTSALRDLKKALR